MALESASFSWANSRLDKDKRPRILFARARIDNRSSLLADLRLADITTDNELILKLYQSFGDECADRLLGDFAFAIWDPARGKIFAARDVMGCQPIYFSNNAKGFFVAERIEHLIEHDAVAKSDDEAFIAATLSYGYAHFERTGFAEIRKIPPGCFLLADENSLTLKNYWQPEQVRQRDWPSHEHCINEFRSLLRQAIADRIPVEGRIGVHVSGGLDCSSIALIAADVLEEESMPRPIAFTWYPEPGADLGEAELEEYERLHAVCNALDVDPVYTDQTPENVVNVLDRDNRIRPICNASYNERPVLAEAQKRGVKVIMSGFGGDEAASFDGRGYLEQLAVTGRWSKLSGFAQFQGRSKLRFVLSKLVHGLLFRFAPDTVLRSYQHNLSAPETSAYKALLFAIIPERLMFWRKPTEFQEQDASEVEAYLHPKLVKAGVALPPIPIVRYSNTRTALCNLLRWPALMTRIEAMEPDAADHGIRYVYPLMDRRIVEFTLSLPPHVFQDANWKRLFFRQVMEPVLPKEVCWRHVKSDPARADPLIDAMMDAFVSIGKHLKQSGDYPETAKYLDVPRLLRDLDKNALNTRSRMGRIISAMEFLGSSTGGSTGAASRSD